MVVIQKSHKTSLEMHALWIVRGGERMLYTDRIAVPRVLEACDDRGDFDLTNDDKVHNTFRRDGSVKEVIYNDCKFVQRTVSLSWKEYIELGRQEKLKESGTLSYEPEIK